MPIRFQFPCHAVVRQAVAVCGQIACVELEPVPSRVSLPAVVAVVVAVVPTNCWPAVGPVRPGSNLTNWVTTPDWIL